jgi:hypothetical protein
MCRRTHAAQRRHPRCTSEPAAADISAARTRTSHASAHSTRARRGARKRTSRRVDVCAPSVQRLPALPPSSKPRLPAARRSPLPTSELAPLRSSFGEHASLARASSAQDRCATALRPLLCPGAPAGAAAAASALTLLCGDMLRSVPRGAAALWAACQRSLASRASVATVHASLPAGAFDKRSRLGCWQGMVGATGSAVAEVDTSSAGSCTVPPASHATHRAQSVLCLLCCACAQSMLLSSSACSPLALVLPSGEAGSADNASVAASRWSGLVAKALAPIVDTRRAIPK